METKKVMLFMGTRPEVIKMFPVWHALKKKNYLQVQVCAVRQQENLLDQTLAAFELKPDFNLKLNFSSFSLPEMAGCILSTAGAFLAEHKPDLVLVQGDTTTACMIAMAAFYERIAVGHVEAGLRTGRFDQPFPEELHRVVIDLFADLCFTPTSRASEALRAQKIPEARIFLTGNTVIDALYYVLQNLPSGPLPPAAQNRKVVLATCHRRENFGEGVQQICAGLRSIAETYQDIELFMIVHPNPNVRLVVERSLAHLDRVHLLPPQDYATTMHLLNRSWLLLTDSGGLQEEAVALGKPTLILREVTERCEAIEAGTARLVGTKTINILNAFEEIYTSPKKHSGMSIPSPIFGDGAAAQRISEEVMRFLFGEVFEAPSLLMGEPNNSMVLTQ